MFFFIPSKVHKRYCLLSSFALTPATCTFFITQSQELSFFKIRSSFFILFFQIEALSSADGSSPPASQDNSSAATSLEF